MKIIPLGHASLRIKIEDQILLIDPWLEGNPAFPDDRRADALDGVTAIFLTHGHFDHAAEIQAIADETGAHIYAIVELASWISETLKVEATGFNKGGTITLGEVKVTMVNATHSSSLPLSDKLIYAGSEAGYMVSGDGHTIYISGDTDVMADMQVFNALHAPDIGILCAGGHFTMDMHRAAFAARTFFNFKTVIPYHYKTFPVLAQSADEMIKHLPDVQVIEPEPMVAIEM
ncbi:metal-dependent hydrolase [Cognatishimia sp. MH4019]|uniref:metal-dependent hydrolase n=1 Tax=Cognatishimia sp. MH4019 TaxID=2854030 RepID=UPI001CD470EB|nr:metal-dependent hydrolase [Cognatishimia sp. MH4019]